ncbi:MAG: hypothetical protein JXQ75_01875 [Phycisphaerae bacterium]|nr:hypothetical protein [Phycisphaerae bacterium]
MSQDAKDNATWAGIAGLLMLVYGWGMGLAGTSDDDFYNTTVAVFDWMLKIGGLCMVVVAVVCFAGQRTGLLIDVLVSGTCGLIMVLCGIYWLLNDGLYIRYMLYIVFGGMFLKAARDCWLSYFASGAVPTGDAATNGAGGRGWLGVKPLEPPKPPNPPKAEAPHPASIRPKSLPKDGEPPPEGYLAALAKEEDEPPAAPVG